MRSMFVTNGRCTIEKIHEGEDHASDCKATAKQMDLMG